MQILFIAFSALMAVLNIAAIYTGVIALFTFKKRRPYPDAAPETLPWSFPRATRSGSSESSSTG